MQETAEDLEQLQQLLDHSYRNAGVHALEVITPERRLDASRLCALLTDMCLLVVATTTRDGRPLTGPVDGYFFRGAWYFGSSKDAVRMGHLRTRPAVSATYLPSEELSVSVHGRATLIDHRSAGHAAFRAMLLERNLPLYGPEWEELIDTSGAYARIEADRMLTFFMPAPS